MANRKIYSKKLGEGVASKAKPVGSHRLHVVLSDGQRWAVVADGNKRASRVFPDQIRAVQFAKDTATRLNGEVVVHKKTGEIEDLVSFAE
jgi:hypothetical protein